MGGEVTIRISNCQNLLPQTGRVEEECQGGGLSTRQSKSESHKRWVQQASRTKDGWAWKGGLVKVEREAVEICWTDLRFKRISYRWKVCLYLCSHFPVSFNKYPQQWFWRKKKKKKLLQKWHLQQPHPFPLVIVTALFPSYKKLLKAINTTAWE